VTEICSFIICQIDIQKINNCATKGTKFRYAIHLSRRLVLFKKALFILSLLTLTACSSTISVIGTADDGIAWTGSIGLDELLITDGNTICKGEVSRQILRFQEIRLLCDDGRLGSLAFSSDTPIASAIQGVITFNDGSISQLYLLGQ
jgi:hypothetical protein